MSESIDFIDLTIDSPTKTEINNISSTKTNNKTKNVRNVPNNGSRTTTKSRKHTLPKQLSTQHNNFVKKVPVKNTHKNVHSTEVIDLDVSSSANVGACYINDSREDNLVVLTCPICYEQLSSKMKPMSTRCGHIFCSKCLELATRKSKKCPTCQSATKFQSCTRLYF